MHIPQNLLDGTLCPVTAVFSGLCLAGAALAAYRSAEKPHPLRFAAVSAFLFAAQMLNFPISSGTSGHLLGGVLASALLGVPFGVLALALVVTAGVLLALYRSRWGLRVRATVSNRPMANATGINTKKTDRVTFAIGCGVAGIAGAAFTTIGSTGPTSGSLYIVDSFLVVTFGGAASLLGTVASAFGIAQTQSIAEFFLTGSMAKVLTLMLIVVILMIRPQGLFASKVRR